MCVHLKWSGDKQSHVSKTPVEYSACSLCVRKRTVMSQVLFVPSVSPTECNPVVQAVDWAWFGPLSPNLMLT